MLKGKLKWMERCLKKVFKENLNVLKVNFSCSVNENRREAVRKFLERDDISNVLPRRKDGKRNRQIRVLSDYIYNLRDKYLEEKHPYVSLSFFNSVVKFTEHILPVSYKKRKYVSVSNIRTLNLS